MPETTTITCAYCKTLNRVDQGRAGAICGKCREPLEVPAGATAVSESNFQQEVLEAKLPVLVDVWAPWCGPCRQLSPLIDALAIRLGGTVKVVKINVDEAPAIAQKLGISGVPTLLAFKNGRMLGRQTGAGSGEQIVGWLRHVGAI